MTSKATETFLFTLNTPETEDDDSYRTRFSDVVKSTLTREQVNKVVLESIICLHALTADKAWCEKCNAYKASNLKRDISNFPEVLAFNTGTDKVFGCLSSIPLLTKQVLSRRFFTNRAFGVKSKKAPEAAAAPTDRLVPPSAQAVMCKYGASCTNRSCKFTHPAKKQGISSIPVDR